MPPETLANRVTILEHKMQSLEGLSDRVASLEVQKLQFRAEVREEISAVHQEMRALGETLRAEMRAGDEETRRQMRVLHEEVIARFALLDEHLNGRKRSRNRAAARAARVAPRNADGKGASTGIPRLFHFHHRFDVGRIRKEVEPVDATDSVPASTRCLESRASVATSRQT